MGAIDPSTSIKTAHKYIMNLKHTLGLFLTTATLASVTFALQQKDGGSGSGSQMVFSPEQNRESFDIKANDKPSLSDLLTVDRALSLFYGYLRESTGLVERLANPLTTTTIFAPVDSSIINLSRKPHQGPPDASKGEGEVQSQPISTEDQEKDTAAYLEKWIKAHMVAGTDVTFDDDASVETLAGDEAKLTFVKLEIAARAESDDNAETEAWRKVLVMPGNARILSRKEGKDGLIYVVDQVLQPGARRAVQGRTGSLSSLSFVHLCCIS